MKNIKKNILISLSLQQLNTNDSKLEFPRSYQIITNKITLITIKVNKINSR